MCTLLHTSKWFALIHSVQLTLCTTFAIIWATVTIYFFSLSVQAFVTAVPDEKNGNWSSEMEAKNQADHQAILGVTNNKIMTAQFECYQKIMQTTEEYEGKQCISIYFDLIFPN